MRSVVQSSSVSKRNIAVWTHILYGIIQCCLPLGRGDVLIFTALIECWYSVQWLQRNSRLSWHSSVQFSWYEMTRGKGKKDEVVYARSNACYPVLHAIRDHRVICQQARGSFFCPYPGRIRPVLILSTNKRMKGWVYDWDVWTRLTTVMMFISNDVSSANRVCQPRYQYCNDLMDAVHVIDS